MQFTAVSTCNILLFYHILTNYAKSNPCGRLFAVVERQALFYLYSKRESL